MSRWLWLVSLAALGLAACRERPVESQLRHGRFTGVGIYSPGELWSKMVGGDAGGEPSAARTADDEHVIVVVNSDTGEIRQCGDLSGYCVAMNPWTKSLLKSQDLPVRLTARPSPSTPPAEAPKP